MKKLINKYKTWKLERIHRWAQWYADYKMINQYNIYLK